MKMLDPKLKKAKTCVDGSIIKKDIIN
jgi:hypothetical protein